jgi:signal transduction histidine kinase/DNA-binding response OmpR family regulator
LPEGIGEQTPGGRRVKSRLPSRFRPDKELGRGGMGIVYKAFDTAYGRDVAVKILPEDIDQEELLYRFRREGSDLAGLSHPNVVHCYEFNTVDNVDFIVMEYVDGGNLRNFVNSSSNLADIVHAYCAICAGLQHIHGQGIVHRDVKPGNILFTSDGIPKITDFGISRRLNSDTQLTQTGTVLGTCSFLAPEMILKNVGLTPSADLYSLGVCLFESITGELPIQGETDYAILTGHINDTPKAPSEIRSEIPPKLDEIVLCLLAKRPEDRPASADAVTEMLQECLEQSLAQKPPQMSEEERATEPTMSDQLLEGLLIIDSQGHIESCNPDAAMLLGRTSAELFGQPVERFLPKMRHLQRRPDKMRGDTFRMEGRKRVEEAIPLEVTLTTTESARGQQLTALIKQGEPDVETLASGLGKAGQFDFLTRLTHEVWTPMNGILGMARLTLNTDLDGTQRKYLKDLETSADRLREVLNTAFDFSRLGDGSLILEPVPIDIRHFVEAALKPHLLQAKARGLDLTSQIDPLVPDTIVADPARLKQILQHLLQNALQFTEQGAIGLSVSRESHEDNLVELKFSVSDTGQGIIRGREKAIFRPFYQEDTSISRTSSGTGLGLAIVQGLVNKMNGRVWVDSQRGRGSVFHFVASFGVAESANRTYRTRLGNLRVLIVDPGQEFLNVENLVKRWGLEVTSFTSPEKAGEAIEAARVANVPYDLILAEVHGAHLDAYDFVQRYKLNHEAFVLFSEEIKRGDSSHCRLLGVDALMDKPVDATELWNTVLRILKEGARSRKADFGSLRILLAEDNPVNQTLATVLLTSRGHEVTTAENGLDVLELLKDHEYDLILMDLQMPHMDGLQTSMKVRSLERNTGRRVPIIALTAHVQGDGLERCLAAGMDDYLNKPLNEDELMESIAKVIDNDAPPSADPQMDEEEETEESEELELPQSQRDTETTNYNVIDEASLLARVGNNSKILCSLIDTFLRLCPSQLGAIKEAVDQGDAENLFQTAHKFKGSVANFSAGTAAEAARRIEELGRNGSVDGAEEMYTKLASETQKLVVALKSIQSRFST